MKIIVNSFAEGRHTPETGFSYPIIKWDEIIRRCKQNIGLCKEGYRPGVILVPVDPDGFYTGVVKLQSGDRLYGAYEPRRPGEDPRKSVRVVGQALPAVAVDIVLYQSAVLAEGDTNEQPPGEDAWEIVSVNARLTEEEEPIHPMTLMANHFGASGGSDTLMKPCQFEDALRQSFEYWKDKAMRLPSQDDLKLHVSAVLRSAVVKEQIDVELMLELGKKINEKL